MDLQLNDGPVWPSGWMKDLGIHLYVNVVLMFPRTTNSIVVLIQGANNLITSSPYPSRAR